MCVCGGGGGVRWGERAISLGKFSVAPTPTEKVFWGFVNSYLPVIIKISFKNCFTEEMEGEKWTSSHLSPTGQVSV